MKKVYSLSEAMKFFMSNSAGSIVCVKDGTEKVCDCYPDAEQFYN